MEKDKEKEVSSSVPQTKGTYLPFFALLMDNNNGAALRFTVKCGPGCSVSLVKGEKRENKVATIKWKICSHLIHKLLCLFKNNGCFPIVNATTTVKPSAPLTT